jgi:hypothetical protein
LKIGTLTGVSERKNFISLLCEFVNVFAWNYADIPSLDTNIVVHKMQLNEGSIPMKPKLQRTHPNMVLKVKPEIKRQ